MDAPEEEGICGFTASAGTVAKDGDKFRLTMPAQNVKIRTLLYGDADADGSVTPKDAMILARYLAGWPGYSVDSFAADVDGDGNVSVRGAVVLARHLAGWEGFKTLPYKT